MSTLCAYENYLRDRYVLGQSIHYAAGSSSPKPKSYDREGNEYTWSDEAGDYVRQVGGPGGGRTIRLSEVEKTEVEQPQNGQANADSGQNGPKKEWLPQSNVDYSEFADAYKRYRAEDKKVASLKRKASKIQKAVLNPSFSATPEEIKSAKESLAKIRDEISVSEEIKASLSSGLNSFTKKHNVVFIDGGDSFVVNPSPELIQGLKQRKSLQDSVKKAQKKAEEAKKAGLKTNASEIASIADKLEGELNRVNDLLSQMFPNETVVSAVDEKPKRRRANKKKEPQEESSEERDVKSASDPGVDANADSFVEGMETDGFGLPSSESTSPVAKDSSSNKDAAYFIRRDLEATPKSEIEEWVEEVDEVSETPSSEAPQRDDDATLERKVKEALGKGEPLRKKATRLRSKAKDAALKGRKEEAAGLRKQADKIEAEARKYIDEATNAGVELKNRRAEASQQPVPETKEPVKKSEVPNSPIPEQQPEPAPQEQPRESFNVTSDNVAGAFDELRRLIKTIDSSEKTYKVLFDRALEHEREHVEKLAADIRSNKRRVAFLARGLRLFKETNHLFDIGRGAFIVNPKDETQNVFRKKKGLEKQLRRARSELRKTTHPVGVTILEGRISRLEQELKAKRDEFNRLLKGEVVSKVRRAGGGAVNKANEKAGDAKQPSETRENAAVPTPDALSGLPQEQPTKPRPERWTPLKSKMNDDDRRVVENTRKRLNFGLADFAWRIADAKEKKDWQKAKELTVLAAQRYLEQARRAYRSHGGADALAAFDETLSGEGLTVGQVRDRVVDKFRQLALMNVADLHKYAGERLDEWEAFSQGAELPATKDKIALNRLLDKPHYAPNAVPYTPPEKGKIYEVPIDSLNLDPNRFQFKLNTNAQGVTDDLEGAEFDPMQAGIIHVWRDPDDGKDYVVNGHHRFNLAKNSGYDGKVNVRYIDADTADDAKAFGAVANIADSKGTATDVAEFIRTRGSDDIRTPAGKKIATKNKLLADGRVLSKLDDTIFRKLKNGSIDEKTARIIAAELPDDKEKQLRLFSDIERLGLDASQAQDRAWAYASIQGEKQQGSLFGDDAPMEYDVESRSKLIGEIRKALGGTKRAAQAGGSSRNNEYWESQKLATNFDRDRAKQLSKSAGQTLDFFKDHIRLTGPVQNIIKEETDEYRKAIKAGKGAEKVVERAIERIKDVAQGGDGSVRRVEGLGLEYEDRLPSAKSEQTRQGVEANGRGEKQKPPRTPSESLRSGTAGEVFEAGGTDRPSDGGDGRNLASVIAEEAQKSDIPKNRVREELDAPRQSKTSTPQEEEKPDWLKDLESQEELKPVSKGKYNPEAKPYSWKLKEPETEDDLREFWRKHVDGGLDEDFTLGSDNKKVSIGGVEGDVPMTVDEMRRFMELRLGRENRKALGLSEHFSEEELKALQSPGEKRGRGRISNATHVNKIAQDAQKSEVPQDQVQKKTADAVHGNATARKPQTPSLQEPGGRNAANSQTLSEPKQQDAGAEPLGENVVQDRIAEALGTPSDASKRKSSRRPKKNFDPSSIKDDVKKAVQIRDADRSQLSTESIDSMMGIAQNVSKKYGVDGLRDFMRRIDIIPVAKSRPKLLQELRDFLEDYQLNRYKATFIRNM